ncbi:MAG: hypothetical protein K6F91_02125, partial [Ruminococcus sp.]|nr:hypothetical protein [Ruminococcus sp.]
KELECQIKELEEKKAAIDNEIKAYMAECGTGVCDGYKVTYKTQVRNTLDKAALTKAHPEIDLNNFMKQSSSRVFKIKEVS